MITASPSQANKRWALRWTLVVLLLSCLPYIIVTLATPEGWQFAGMLVNPLDGHSYLAKMQQGSEGNWLFHLTYTPEPHEPTFIFTFYLALGQLTRISGLPAIWIFHLARLAAGFFLLRIAFRFITAVTPSSEEQRLAFGLLISAAGFGWLGVMFGAFPIDLWVPEAFVPYSLYANPHFPLGMGLMLIILHQIVWPTRDNLKKFSLLPIIKTGFAALALALILPFALLTVWAALAVFFIFIYTTQRRLPWLQIWPTLGSGLFAGPIILYDYWISTTNPILAGWSAQNVTTAPSLLNLGLGYGLVGLLALGGGLVVLRQRQPASIGLWLILIWAITTLFLIYAPFNLQRRLINGFHIPLCILAAVGIQRGLKGRLQPPTHHRLIMSVVVLGVVGTVFVWSLPLIGALQSPEQSPITALLFMRRDEVAAFTWLRENSLANDIILASPRLGMFIPGQTGARVFYGHPFETIAADEKKAAAEAFFHGVRDNVSPAVDYIIYGPSEQALGRPKNLSNYSVAFSAGEVVVYTKK